MNFIDSMNFCLKKPDNAVVVKKGNVSLKGQVIFGGFDIVNVIDSSDDYVCVRNLFDWLDDFPASVFKELINCEFEIIESFIPPKERFCPCCKEHIGWSNDDSVEDLLIKRGDSNE